MSAALQSLMNARATAGGGGGGGFSVNFTLGANGDPLSGYTGWSPTANWALDDNVGAYTRGMHNTTASFNYSYRNASLSDGTFTVRIHTDATYAVEYAALYARADAVSAGYIALQANSSSLTWHVQIYDNAGTPHLDHDTTVAWTPGTTYDMALVLSGSSVIAKINGTQVGATQTDSWVSANTYCGWGFNGNGTNQTTCESISAA